MAYKLYIDKPEEFICEVAVKNASLKNAFARMVIESEDLTFMFNGTIKDGKCNIPIKRLKGFLDENSKGKMYLEIIVEDVYFKPWEDNFMVEEHTSVKVKVNEQKTPSKPILEVKPIAKQTIPVQDILYVCKKLGINKNNLGEKKNYFKEVIKEYFKATPEFINESKKCIKEVLLTLP